VKQAIAVEVDGRPAATAGRFLRAGASVAAIVAADGAKQELGAATQLRFVGLVDLASSSRLRTGPRPPVGLKTRGMSHPALLWVVRNEEKVAPTARDRGRRWTGERETETLFVVDLRLRVLLRLEIRVRSPDGFGGFTLGTLSLEQRDSRTLLTTTRQDHLPASRARCLEPEPYEVVFELVEGRFRRVSGSPPAPSNCR
jgi:hypothetical protein